jgi:glycosidase
LVYPQVAELAFFIILNNIKERIRMAKDTSPSCQNAIIYEIFVRNHSVAGNFDSVIADLDRIKALGVDIIWLMPVHPVGKEKRKGTLGSPYAITDYRSINDDYGTIESFITLIQEIHARGMKVVMDIVYNHVAPDSTVVAEFPEWLKYDSKEMPTRKVADWTDVVDLDYSQMALWDFQAETLKFWIQIGVDGFRCDVASMLPVDFWRYVREEITEAKKDVIWLAETVAPDFLLALRSQGHPLNSDCEMYEAFDMTYDYDGYYFLKQYLTEEIPLSEYVNYLLAQDFIYPVNYCKMRFLENHDQVRALELCETEANHYNWTAFQIFLKGAFLLYAGQEIGAKAQCSLFEKDPISWNEENTAFNLFVKRMIRLKKSDIVETGKFTLYPSFDFIAAKWELDGHGFFGIFNVEGITGERKIYLPDGSYSNYLAKGKIDVKKGKVQMQEMPIILRYS